MSESASAEYRSASTYTCPVCGYTGLTNPPYYPDEWGSPSWDICPSCGTEFGYQDAAGYDAALRATRHAWLREQWRAAGAPWDALRRGKLPPAGWDPDAQVQQLLARIAERQRKEDERFEQMQREEDEEKDKKEDESRRR